MKRKIQASHLPSVVHRHRSNPPCRARRQASRHRRRPDWTVTPERRSPYRSAGIGRPAYKRYLPRAGHSPPPAASTGAHDGSLAALPSPFQIDHLAAGRTPTRLAATGLDSHWRRRGCTSRGAGRHSRSPAGPGRGGGGGGGGGRPGRSTSKRFFLVAAWATTKPGKRGRYQGPQPADNSPPNRRARPPVPCKQRRSRQGSRPEALRRGPSG